MEEGEEQKNRAGQVGSLGSGEKQGLQGWGLMDNIPCRPPRYLGLRFTPPDASSPLKNRSLTQSPGHLGTSSPHSGESLIHVTKEEHEALSAFSRYIPVGVVNKGLVRIVCEEGGGGD